MSSNETTIITVQNALGSGAFQRAFGPTLVREVVVINGRQVSLRLEDGRMLLFESDLNSFDSDELATFVLMSGRRISGHYEGSTLTLECRP